MLWFRFDRPAPTIAKLIVTQSAEPKLYLPSGSNSKQRAPVYWSRESGRVYQHPTGALRTENPCPTNPPPNKKVSHVETTDPPPGVPTMAGEDAPPAPDRSESDPTADDPETEILGTTIVGGAPDSTGDGSKPSVDAPVSERRRCGAPPEAWESVGREALAERLEDARDELRRGTNLAVSDVRYGEAVTGDHLDRLRDAVAAYQHVVEFLVTDLVEDAEPYERTADRIPAGPLRAALDEPASTADDAAGTESDDAAEAAPAPDAS